MQYFRQQTMETSPAGAVGRRVLCTNASLEPSLWRNAQFAARRAGKWIRAFLRAGGLAAWRFVALLVILSFLTAWVGTRALIAGFEDTWTGIALTAARHENLLLRDRQDALREQTEEALAHLGAVETTYARTP